MATLEDKLLGEKLHNYCSSSEDENSDSEEEKASAPPAEPTPPEPSKWEGTATNTGPKGVIKDWQRFKQLESEKRGDQERERIALMKKLTLTCRSTLDDEREKAMEEDPDLAEFLNDEFLFEYQKQRMQEMLRINTHENQFGKVLHLCSGQEFLDAIDKEAKTVTVVIHIFEENVEACQVMNECFDDLSVEFPAVKFCKIIASKAGMSKDFKSSGVPALLVYKSGQLVGNFVRISDELGSNFTMEEVQEFLIQHGMLLDKTFVPKIISEAN